MEPLGFFLRKRFWILNMVVVATCSVFAGRAAADMIEAAWFSDVPPPRRVRAHAPPPPAAHGKEPTAIIERNVFCSGCLPPSALRKAAQAKASRDLKKTVLPLALQSIELTDDDATSMAVIRDLTGTKRNVAWFIRGNPVFDTGAKVERIADRRVYLRVAEGREYLDLDDPPAGSGSSPAPVQPVVKVPGDALASEMDRSISCNGGNCQIDRSLVDHLLQNTMTLATSARFVPNIQNGRPAGFRLFAIRPNSLFARIGLQNGDVVKSINGNSMSSPDQALEVYTKLRYASHLSVEVERRGSTSTMDYLIR